MIVLVCLTYLGAICLLFAAQGWPNDPKLESTSVLHPKKRETTTRRWAILRCLSLWNSRLNFSLCTIDDKSTFCGVYFYAPPQTGHTLTAWHFYICNQHIQQLWSKDCWMCWLQHILQSLSQRISVRTCMLWSMRKVSRYILKSCLDELRVLCVPKPFCLVIFSLDESWDEVAEVVVHGYVEWNVQR